MLGGIGMTELIIILVIVLIIFGAGKLPEIGKGLGKGIKNFKKAVNDTDSEQSDSRQKEIDSDTSQDNSRT